MMKKLLIVCSIILTSAISWAEDTTLVFTDVQYSELFNKATEEGKGVMLYFHFDGCGGCLQMERTVFKDSQAIGYFKENYLCFDINTLSEEGKSMAKRFEVRMNPCFLFLDEMGNQVHKIVGSFNTEEFIQHASEARQKGKTLGYYKEMYSSGNREPEFLYDRVRMLQDANELDSLALMEYLNTQSLDALKEEKNVKFLYEFMIQDYRSFHNLFSTDSPYFQFVNSHRELMEQYFERDQIRARILFCINNDAYLAIEKKDSTSFFRNFDLIQEFDTGETYLYKNMKGLLKAVLEEKGIANRLKADYYRNIGDLVKYEEIQNSYVQEMWNNATQLNMHAWVITQNSDKRTDFDLKMALKCIERSIELKSQYANNDTYAWVLYYLGQKKRR
ncbi:MAG: hypothetical protein N4A41_10525 [Crocinitomicaceae bacterium]|jgi:thioredoxin-related protein|nr:hypothetical protein [Crocinitomicaceae bacterium]